MRNVRAQSMTNLSKEQLNNSAYASTSHYLRQAVGTEKARSMAMEQAILKNVKPAYKSQEEYYDEVISLKRQIHELTSENTELKRMVRRKEEEYSKKRKEVEQLLDPAKMDAIGRVQDGKANNAATVNSLKQRILQLEQQCRDKQEAYSKLQSDLKTTKMEEMKVQLETLYNEILRLKKDRGIIDMTPQNTARRGPEGGLKGKQKIKSLTATVMRMSVEKAHLQAENKLLKIDLQKCLDSKDTLPPRRPRSAYEASERESRVSFTHGKRPVHSAVNGDANHTKQQDTAGKLMPVGSLAQRYDQLDRRESELLEEISIQKSIISKLKKDIRQLRERNAAETDLSARRPDSNEDADRRDRAARSIQKRWQRHRVNVAHDDDAADMIMTTLRGNEQRVRSVTDLRRSVGSYRSSDDDDDDDDYDTEGAAELIESNLRGHHYRSQRLRSWSPHSG